ncbi:MAG: hypothetical protein SFX18_15880 [Pirellulales bacterium]|nr:hypothetical protein [Pirellulales bacterium]
MMITSFYYLSYPDSLPTDELVAASEVYVEVSETEGSIEHFDHTYAIQVCTIEYIRQQLGNQLCFYAKSIIVVERFSDDVIKLALESVLSKIDEIAIKK